MAKDTALLFCCQKVTDCMNETICIENYLRISPTYTFGIIHVFEIFPREVFMLTKATFT